MLYKIYMNSTLILVYQMLYKIYMNSPLKLVYQMLYKIYEFNTYICISDAL